MDTLPFVENINLSNLKRCNQFWENMPDGEQGRICQKCQNTIIDFRKLSQPQIAAVHLRSKQPVCGLYLPNQLKLPPRRIPIKRQNFLKHIVLSAISWCYTITTQAQTTPTEVNTIQVEPDCTTNKTNTAASTNKIAESFIIKGVIRDQNNELLPYVNVYEKNYKIGTTSNFEGEYFLNVTDILDSVNEITLKFTYLGSEPQEFQITRKQFNNSKPYVLDVTLEAGEIIAFYVYEKRPWYKRVGFAVAHPYLYIKNKFL